MNYPDHLAVCATLAFLASVNGCGHTSAAEPEPAVATAPHEKPRRVVVRQPQPPANASIGDAMADHFAITSFARDAVTAGLLEPLHEPLVALARYHYDDARAGGWMPWIAQLQTTAQLTSQAVTLDAAAMGVATMARICGECHVATRDGPTWSPPMAAEEERPEADTIEERMGRHMWAAEQLWKGLTGPSDGHWNAGARALIDAPTELDAQLPEDFDDDLREVRALSRSASEATALPERANVYASLIATCAECHSRWIDHGE
jgi:cytochrome c553